MGTNYYLRCREPRMVYDSYHIAKRSSGWEPSFEGYPYEGDYAHDGFDHRRPHIGSVADIKAAYDTGLYDIVDEYGFKLSWDEFERDVVGWDGGSAFKRERVCHKVPGKMHYGERRSKCSLCGYGLGDDRWAFCPKCGARVERD